ncbi:MAG: Na/Pi symporter, partial [Pseudomonadota bacterium]|nr:Na/Pi symporter [Pseudomonadota bacterium]
FKSFSGGVLEAFLQRTTDKTWKSLLFGMVSTTFMQSSSLVSVLTISFLSAGLIGLAQGIGIIFGSNLGTTTGAWLVAGFGLKVDIAAYAMPMLVFGAILMFQKDSPKVQGGGYILIGLGFLFLGIAYMKEGFESAGGQIDLSQYAIGGFKGLLVYTGIGIAATVIMQSSHATLILTITALAAGQVTYENALALAIGSNVGTTVTAVIGALNANIAGRRLAAAHLIFNLLTGAIAILFIKQFAQVVDYVSELVGIAADNYTLKFAVFHTLFNLVGVVLMLPAISFLVRFLEKVLREKVEEPDVARPLFLNDASLEFPDTALQVIIRETTHLAYNAFEILAHGLNLHREDVTADRKLEEVVEQANEPMELNVDDLYVRRVKPLYSAIVEFASHAERNMNPDQVNQLNQLKLANWELVSAVKAMKELQVNIDRFSGSDNRYVVHEYSRIRLQIAEVLRVLFRFDREGTLVNQLELLQGVKLEMEQEDIVANGALDKLIRKERITPDMATSLMNDSAYAYDIQNDLIHAAERVLAGVIASAEDIERMDEEINRKLVERRDQVTARIREEEEAIDRLDETAGGLR